MPRGGYVEARAIMAIRSRKANNLEASDIGSPFHYEKITAMLR
jgi:hypothetical protein